VHKVENLLIKSGKLSLPGQKELRKLSDPETVLVIDVMESPVERPKKGQKGFYSGKLAWTYFEDPGYYWVKNEENNVFKAWQRKNARF
jgi:hypothetical protein